MAELSGKQIERLQQAILGAFEPDELRQFLRTRLDKDLSHIAAGGNLTTVVFDVITKAEREGWTTDLLCAVAEARPKRQDVQDLVKELLAHLKTRCPPPPPPPPPPRIWLWLVLLLGLLVLGILLWSLLRPNGTSPGLVTPTITPPGVTTRLATGSPADTAVPPTMTPAVSSMAAATSTPTASSAPAAAATPTPTTAPTVGPPITAANAGSVTQVNVIKPFGSPVDIALSPDGQTLATATNFNILVYALNDLETPRLTLEGHKTLSQVAFSPDGRLLASAGSSFDDTIRLWDMAAGGAERGVLQGHTEAIFDIAFNSDGRLLASGSRDNSVRMWDVETGKETFLSLAHDNWVHAVAFSPDGVTLASGGADGTIRLWDAQSGEVKGVLDAHSTGADSLAFSPDGKLLASAGQYDTGIRLWDTQTWQTITILRGHVESAGFGVYSLTFNGEGTLLASGGGDKTIRLWDVRRDASSFGAEVAALKGHSDWVDSLLFTPDGTTLISASERDGTIRFWEAVLGEDTMTITPTATTAPTIGPPITAANAGTVAQVSVVKTFGSPNDVALSPDGKTLAATTFNVQVYDLTDLETPRFELGESQGPNQVAFSPDGQLLASGDSGFDGTIRLWDMAAGGAERGVLGGHTEAIYDIAFSPDGGLLASGSRDKSVRMWDVGAGKETFSSLDHGGEVHSVAFSPDGATLASGGADGNIRLWEVRNGQTTRVLDAHPSGVDSLVFSPDGKLLASAGQYDTGIRLWDTQTWQTVSILRGHTESAGSGVYSLAFNAEGTLLASGGADKTIRLWDVRRDAPSFGAEVAALKGHSDWVDSLLFTPDGTTLISASERDGTVRFWEAAATGG